MAYAGRPIETALEIGAGTGKGTRLFARAGVAVTATEPDAAMIAELRKHVPTTVTVVQAAFEDLHPDQTYGLVYAAAALHWTRPEGRWSQVASLLSPGGVFAAFGGPVQLADSAIEAAVRAARAPYLASDELASPDPTPTKHELQWPGTELELSEWFVDVQQHFIERRFTVSASDYVRHLSTISAYLELPAPDQKELYAAITAVLPHHVEIDADITVHLARAAEDMPSAGPTRVLAVTGPDRGVHPSRRRTASGETVRALSGADEPAEIAEHPADDTGPIGVAGERSSSVRAIAHPRSMSDPLALVTGLGRRDGIGAAVALRSID
jgi:SAM-dependent methyltransferase